MIRTLAVALTTSTCIVALAAPAAAQTREYRIPAGPLKSALDAYARQTGRQVIYRADEVRSVRSPGVNDALTDDAALNALLSGTGFKVTADSSGALAIMKLGNGQGATDNSSSSGEGSVSELTANEIVVTAQKREQGISQVPIAITAVTGKQLDDNRIVGLQDLAFTVPGLDFQTTAPGLSLIVIRGVAADRGTSVATSVYLDEIPLTVGSSPERNPDLSTQDLQRVEVLKGPQGTLFGESSMGGTIRYVTKDPLLDQVEGSVDGTYFLTDRGAPSHELNAVVNLPLVDDVLGVRVVSGYAVTGGWIDKVTGPGGAVVDKNFNSVERRNIRIKALWKPSDRLSISGMIISQRSDYDGSDTINVDAPEQSHYQGAFDTNRDDSNNVRNQIYNLTATYDLGFAQILSSTSKFKINQFTTFSEVYRGDSFLASIVGLPDTGDPVSIEIRSEDYISNTSAFAQELRLTSADNGPFKWTVGGYYKDSEAFQDRNFSVKINGATLIDSVTNGPPIPTIAKIRTEALFADGSVELMKRLEVGGGLRQVWERRIGYPIMTSPTSGQILNYSKLTYRAFMRYELADRFSIYANTGTGFRAGGLNDPTQVLLGAPRSYAPEVLTSYEIGAKGALFDGMLNGSLALYTSDWSGIQSFTTNPVPFYQYTVNSGKVRIKGVELELAVKPSANWELGFNGDITHGRFVKVDPSGANPYIVGDSPNFTPKYNFTVYSDYRFALSDDVSGLLHVDYHRQGASTMTVRGGITLLDTMTIPPVGFLNARFDVDWHDWTFRVFSDNFLNEHGFIIPSVGGMVSQHRPRTVGITVIRKF